MRTVRRTLAIILVLVAVAALAAASVGLPGSPLSPLPPPEEQDHPSDGEDGIIRPPDTLWKSAAISFGYEGPTYLVIQTQAEWEALWDRANREAPEVDFANRTVLVALYGEAPTSGYDVSIDEVREADGGVDVAVTFTTPGPSCTVLQVLTYPVHMVSIPKADGPFDFQAETVTLQCR